ncbi:MAG: hypothetical protein RJB62_1079 [Pseudomonadota bacterium]|jgi:hypothetical protein
MPRIFFTALVLAAGLATPAAAQDQFTESTAAANALFENCLAAAEAGPPARAIAECESAERAVTDLQSRYPDALLWEKDFIWLMRAGIHMQVSGAYGDADGVRSARVCERTERWWLALGNITPGSAFDQSGNGADQNLVRQCRSEHGTPSWARPLP